jgi:hypothetical protein
METNNKIRWGVVFQTTIVVAWALYIAFFLTYISYQIALVDSKISIIGQELLIMALPQQQGAKEDNKPIPDERKNKELMPL